MPGITEAMGKPEITGRRPGPAADFARLLVAALAGALVLVGVGWAPTSHVAGRSGIVAMAVGIGISLAGSVAAALPIAWARSPAAASRQIAFLGAMALRMFITLSIFAVVAVCEWVAARPLAVWTGLSYLGLLGIETTMAVRLSGKRGMPTA